jgi:signal transduction histidine kinase
MKLRSHLLLLAFASAAPVMVLAVVIAVLVVKQERDTVRDAAGDRVVAVMSAVDAELRGSIATLRAMAASGPLERGDLKAFHAEASRVLGTHPDWITFTLARPGGERVLDAAHLPGAALGAAVDPPSFELALKTGEPVIGSLVLGPRGENFGIPLRMAVRGTDGSFHYVLTVVLRPEAFGDVLRAQRLPEGWVVNLIDGAGNSIARLPPVAPGTPASQSLRDAVARSAQGWFRGETIEGRKVYTPHVSSSLSGWSLGIGMPLQAVDAAAWRSLWLVVAMVLIATGIAIGLALLVGSRIARPIAALAHAAEASARGERAGFARRTPIDELDSLAAALGQAAAAARERQDLIEREKAALQAADRAKDEFLAMLSHELRNPLAALTTAAHVIKLAPPASEAAIKARAVIERQLRHMARLIGDLLDVSRVAMGKVQLHRERLDLGELVNGVVHTWRTSGRLERHFVSLGAQHVWVDADRSRMEQIVSNLLDNALKFTPAGKRVEVAVEAQDQAAVLRVSDEGEGLAPGASERMFELFVQGERGLDRAAGGMGVGLALVKRLAELHGGTVAAESPGPGKGATFRVMLPSVPPAVQRDAPPARAPAPPRTVLIVEDNDDARHMLEEALAFSGHRVRAARDGASGVTLAAEVRPDVALIDIGLPDLDGYEVARRIRAAPGGRRMGLIALTGYGQAEDQKRAFDAGFDAHLTKPVTPERLKQVMAGLS